MSLGGDRLVVATSNRKISIFDLRKSFHVPEQTRDSSLKYQTRCVHVFPDGQGYALGSVEGRVAMEFLEAGESQGSKYAFKCHRTTDEDGKDVAFPVNCMAFHPKFGTFATGGCDGFVRDYASHCGMDNLLLPVLTHARFACRLTYGTVKTKSVSISIQSTQLQFRLWHSTRMARCLLWHHPTPLRKARNRTRQRTQSIYEAYKLMKYNRRLCDRKQGACLPCCRSNTSAVCNIMQIFLAHQPQSYHSIAVCNCNMRWN